MTPGTMTPWSDTVAMDKDKRRPPVLLPKEPAPEPSTPVEDDTEKGTTSSPSR
jgi:hypothetical protein